MYYSLVTKSSKSVVTLWCSYGEIVMVLCGKNDHK